MSINEVQIYCQFILEICFEEDTTKEFLLPSFFSSGPLSTCAFVKIILILRLLCHSVMNLTYLILDVEIERLNSVSLDTQTESCGKVLFGSK